MIREKNKRLNSNKMKKVKERENHDYIKEATHQERAKIKYGQILIKFS